MQHNGIMVYALAGRTNHFGLRTALRARARGLLDDVVRNLSVAAKSKKVF